MMREGGEGGEGREGGEGGEGRGRRAEVAVHYNSTITRPQEEQRLRNYMDNPPCGPVVIVGPEGCGKSNLLKKVFVPHLQVKY